MKEGTHFRQIDEDLLKKASILSAPGNSFERVLKMGEEYRSAGLTPIYFADENNMMLHVTSEETFNHKLN